MGQGFGLLLLPYGTRLSQSKQTLRLRRCATVDNAITLLHRRRALHSASLIRGEDVPGRVSGWHCAGRGGGEAG